jgi:hypothetical protein
MNGANDQFVHVWLVGNVLCGLTLARVTARYDTDRGVVGHVGH